MFVAELNSYEKLNETRCAWISCCVVTLRQKRESLNSNWSHSNGKGYYCALACESGMSIVKLLRVMRQFV